MDEALLRDIERARQEGAIILLKWDGERSDHVCTVVITHKAMDFQFRKDTDDMFTTLREILREFWEAKGVI